METKKQKYNTEIQHIFFTTRIQHKQVYTTHHTTCIQHEKLQYGGGVALCFVYIKYIMGLNEFVSL